MGDFNAASFYGEDSQDLRGPPGDKGDKGDQGNPGPRGEEGKDAYQVWLDLGNVGTPQDFIDSLTGPMGHIPAIMKVPYRFGGFASVSPVASEVLLLHELCADVVFPANLADTVGRAVFAPNADYPLDVTLLEPGLDPVPLGTITFHDDGSSTVAGPATELTAHKGALVKVTAAPSVDPGLANLSFTLSAFQTLSSADVFQEA